MMVSVLWVVASGLMNALWNLFAKQSRHKGVFLGLIMTTAAVVLLPHLVWELTKRTVPLEAYFWMVCSMALQACYARLLARTYRLGDISSLYPVMRGTGVVLIPMAGVLLLGERLTVWGWIGIAAIVSGMLSSRFGSLLSPSSDVSPNRSLAWAFSTGLCIACYTIVDKITLQYLSPLSLLQVSSLGFVLGQLPDLLKRDRVREEWSLNGRWILLGSLLSPGSYLLFLFAVDSAPVSHLAPIREIGTVFAALLGVLLLKEKQGSARIAASIVIAGGIMVLGFRG